MTFSCSKSFEWSASHVLEGLEPGHQCGRLHGHNYRCEVEVAGSDVGPEGFVLDYAELSPVKVWIDRNLDHRHLNDVLMVNPTAELLARHLYETAWHLLTPVISDRERKGVVVRIVAVRVYETPKTCAEYRP